jgi:hypothetical protein
MNAWKERNFRLLFIGQATSALGNAFAPVALAFAVLGLTHSAADVGYVFAANSICLIMFLLIGGVIADRVATGTDNCRRYGPRFGPVASRHPAGDQPPTGSDDHAVRRGDGHGHRSVYPGGDRADAVAAAIRTPPAGKRTAANRERNRASLWACHGGSPGLVVTAGPGWAIIADSASFFVSVICLASIRIGDIPRPAPQHWVRDLRDGWTDFWHRRWFRTAVLGSSLFNLLYPRISSSVR